MRQLKHIRLYLWLAAILLAPGMARAVDESQQGSGAQSTGRQSLGPQQRLRLRQFMERRAKNGQGSPEGQGAAAQAKSAAIDPNKVTVQKDVPYGKEPRQRLDIYLPKQAAAPMPVLVFAHGGGWQVGNKSQHIEKGAKYAESGVIFVSINYRLAPETKHPEQIRDLASAFAWVKHHATEIGADPNRIFLMGHSAGAQLVDLLATNDRFLTEQGLSLKDIKGVISLDTASLNLADRLTEGSAEGLMVGDMIKSAFGTDPKVLADASPTANIHAGKTYPPFLMFCGKRRLSCVAQHDRFAQALKKVGGEVTVIPVPLSHGEISKAAGQPGAEIFQRSLAFVQGEPLAGSK
jgi:arylformamidase